MHHHARRLHDHGEIRVLIDHLKGQILRLNLDRLRLIDLERDRLAGLQRLAGLCRPRAVHLRLTVANQPFHPGAGQARLLGQEQVEPRARLVRRHPPLTSRHRVFLRKTAPQPPAKSRPR